MPLPLLIPVVAAAASSSSSFSLFTLITSTTLALTGGLAVGAELSSSSSNSDNTSNNMSLSALMNDMYKETEDVLMYVFRDFKNDKKVLVECTAQLSTLSAQLNEAAEATKKTTQNLQEQLEKPLERVGNELAVTKTKTDEVLSQLTEYKTALTQVNAKIGALTATLNKQEETVIRLSAQVIPLTNALSIQTNQKGIALREIKTLKAALQQQQHDMIIKLEEQAALNTALCTQNNSLEQQLLLVNADYQKTMAQKLTLETLITEYNNQQTAAAQRIKELEEAYKVATSTEGKDSKETKKAYEQKINALMLEKQKLEASCAQQIAINNSLNQTILLLKQKITSLDASLVELNKDYDGSKKELEQVNVLIASLRANSKEQETIIAAQEQMIETLMTRRPSKTAGSLGMFSKKASVTQDATSTNPSPNFH